MLSKSNCAMHCCNCSNNMLCFISNPLRLDLWTVFFCWSVSFLDNSQNRSCRSENSLNHFSRNILFLVAWAYTNMPKVSCHLICFVSAHISVRVYFQFSQIALETILDLLTVRFFLFFFKLHQDYLCVMCITENKSEN